jgi:RsiW-degrading membrane proteinase PrsW (M82 family)
MNLIALALAPGIAICLFFFYKDIYNREPKLNLLISFVLGGLAILPAIWFEKRFSYVLDGTVSGAMIFAYFVVAFSEEGSKFLGLRLYSFNQKSFDEPFDGIVYAVMVSMGFATVENIKYVVYDTQSLQVAYMRMFLSVPAHGTFAVVMGYFAGRAKMELKNKTLLIFLGLISAMFFHGTFDFFLFIKQYTFWGQDMSEALLFGGAIASFIVSIALSRRLIRKDLSYSKALFKDKNTTTSV